MTVSNSIQIVLKIMPNDLSKLNFIPSRYQKVAEWEKMTKFY